MLGNGKNLRIVCKIWTAPGVVLTMFTSSNSGKMDIELP
jgi:hypothetical protein